MKFCHLLTTILMLSALTLGDDDSINKKTLTRHKRRNTEEEYTIYSRARKRRQILDGRPPVHFIRGLRSLMNGFDVVLKSTRNADVLKCIPRFVCEMTAPLTEEGGGSADEAESSTNDVKEEESATEEANNAEEGEHDEKEGTSRTADPDLIRQVMQAMFQIPLAFPSPFMPPPNQFMFNPFLNTVAPTVETEKTTTAPETTTADSIDVTSTHDSHSENEIPRPVRQISPFPTFRPVRRVVRPYHRGSSHRSLRPVRRPASQVRHPINQVQAFHPPSAKPESLIEPREFSLNSRFLHDSQIAANTVSTKVSSNYNHRFVGSDLIRRKDEAIWPRPQPTYPKLSPSKWKPTNATSFFDGRRMRTIRRYERIQDKEDKEDNLFKRLFRGRKRRSTSDNVTTIEEIKSRVRRGIKEFIDNAGVTAREIMGALERMDDEGELGTTSSFYPGIRAGLLGYMGDQATCEEEFKDCPTSTDEFIKTYTDIRSYYPNGFTFRNRIPRPFRYLIP